MQDVLVVLVSRALTPRIGAAWHSSLRVRHYPRREFPGAFRDIDRSTALANARSSEILVDTRSCPARGETCCSAGSGGFVRSM